MPSKLMYCNRSPKPKHCEIPSPCIRKQAFSNKNIPESPQLKYHYNEDNNSEPHYTVRLSTSPTPPPVHSGIMSTCTEALRLYRIQLTHLEQQEIKEYPLVYYLGLLAQHRASGTGHLYKAYIGSHIAYRYEILEELDKGTFGQVFKCFDHKLSRPVAIKILKGDSTCARLSLVEIRVLEVLNSSSSEDSAFIVKLLGNFTFRGRICLVFELLGMNLREFGAVRSLSLLKRITTQLLRALRFLHSHKVIHADVKPENIVFKNRQQSSIKLIDFGTVAILEETDYDYVQTRPYRAPEIALECPYDQSIDMWSVGCVLYELYTGDILFPADSEQDLIAMIVDLLGPAPLKVMKRARRKWVLHSKKDTLKRVRSQGRARMNLASFKRALGGDDSGFADFILKALKWDPGARMTSESALQHSWITGLINER